MTRAELIAKAAACRARRDMRAEARALDELRVATLRDLAAFVATRLLLVKEWRVE